MKDYKFVPLKGGFCWEEVEVPDRPISKHSETDDWLTEQNFRASLIKMGAPFRHIECRPDYSGLWGKAFDLLISRMGTGFTIGLIGKRGNGKTQMGVALLIAMMRSGKSARFTSATSFFMKIRATFKQHSEETEDSVVNLYREPSFLVVDEIGKRSDTDWENTVLFELLNKRYCDKKDTLLIANLSAADFADAIGSSISSRMAEDGGIMECEWESFR